VLLCINPAGEILGYSPLTSSGLFGPTSGFLRDGNGTFNTFDVPGAISYVSALVFYGPPGSSLNPSGEAVGGYLDANSVFHGFVRDNHGVITTFDAPGADINPADQVGTVPLSINAAGEATGYYWDATFSLHGFFRDKHGTVTDFDPPGYSTACNGVTFPTAINAAGEIVGNYEDAECFVHGFLRERNGAFTVVDVPGSPGTFPLTINDGKVIAGWFQESNGDGHWFVRDNRGSFSTFDTPDVRDFIFMDINPAGVIVGSYLDSNLVFHSFRRTPDGTLTAIGVSGATGTNAKSINPAGVITGNYSDANGNHGFLFLPQ
jgi:hypothetical protein